MFYTDVCFSILSFLFQNTASIKFCFALVFAFYLFGLIICNLIVWLLSLESKDYCIVTILWWEKKWTSLFTRMTADTLTQMCGRSQNKSILYYNAFVQCVRSDLDGEMRRQVGVRKKLSDKSGLESFEVVRSCGTYERRLVDWKSVWVCWRVEGIEADYTRWLDQVKKVSNARSLEVRDAKVKCRYRQQ